MTAELDHLSYSSVTTYLECRAKWKFRYVDRLTVPATAALAFGSALHDAIEAVLRGRMAGESIDPQAAWSRAWGVRQEAQEIDWGGEHPDTFENLGARLLAHPDVEQTLGQLTPALIDGEPAIERRLTLQVASVPIPVIGFLDMLASDGVIVDFKTAARAWSPEQARQESQPLFYLAAANQAGLPHAPGKFRHVVFVKTRTPQVQVIDSEHSLSEVLWILQVIEGVWQGIAAGHFGGNPKACFAWGRRCEYFDVCRGRR